MPLRRASSSPAHDESYRDSGVEALAPRPGQHRQPLAERQALEEPAHGSEFEVRVRIHQAGQQHGGPEVDAPIGGVGRRQRVGRSHPCDMRTVHHDRATGNRRRHDRQHPVRRVDRARRGGHVPGGTVGRVSGGRTLSRGVRAPQRGIDPQLHGVGHVLHARVRGFRAGHEELGDQVGGAGARGQPAGDRIDLAHDHAIGARPIGGLRLAPIDLGHEGAPTPAPRDHRPARSP